MDAKSLGKFDPIKNISGRLALFYALVLPPAIISIRHFRGVSLEQSAPSALAISLVWIVTWCVWIAFRRINGPSSYSPIPLIIFPCMIDGQSLLGFREMLIFGLGITITMMVTAELISRFLSDSAQKPSQVRSTDPMADAYPDHSSNPPDVIQNI